MQSTPRLIVLFSSATVLLASALTPRTAAAQSAPLSFEQYQEQLHQDWRHTMHRTRAPQQGCYHASYPRTEWEKVDCAAPPAYRSARPDLHVDTVGNGYDYVAQAPYGTSFSSVTGSFPAVSNITSERGANVPFGNGRSDGITGNNQYTLQVNTNFVNTAACVGYSGCLAWQQYVLSTDTPVSLTSNRLSGNTEVFIEYWLINYGGSRRASCPSGFLSAGADTSGVDCVQNTPATVVYNGQLPATQLASLQLSGTVAADGTDMATATYGTEAYTASVLDSFTDMAGNWTQAEFNVLGNAGGSRADFNKGASITVNIAVTDGSTDAPTCTPPTNYNGTTGETNNLTLGNCTSGGGSTPYIQFTESD